MKKKAISIIVVIFLVVVNGVIFWELMKKPQEGIPQMSSGEVVKEHVVTVKKMSDEGACFIDFVSGDASFKNEKNERAICYENGFLRHVNGDIDFLCGLTYDDNPFSESIELAQVDLLKPEVGTVFLVAPAAGFRAVGIIKAADENEVTIAYTLYQSVA